MSLVKLLIRPYSPDRYYFPALEEFGKLALNPCSMTVGWTEGNLFDRRISSRRGMRLFPQKQHEIGGA